MAKETTFLVTATVVDIYTEKSGERFSDTGEFLISVNGKKFPHASYIRMTKKDLFVPPNQPTIFAQTFKGVGKSGCIF